MSIFKIIKNYLTDKKEPEIKTNRICIQISDDGFFDIELFIENTDQTTSKHMSEFLYKINSGQLYDNIIGSMIEYSKNYPNKADYILNIIYNWGLCIKKNKNQIQNNDPVIKPSKVFRNNG